MKHNIQDERIIGESNRIYKLCFYILCGGIFLDLIVKWNLYTFWETISQTLQLFAVESLLLVAVFYLNIFLLAKRGIAFGVTDCELTTYPKKRYAILAGTISLAIAIGLWTPRFVVGGWEYGVGSAILFCGAIYLLTFVAAFLVLYTSFYFAFCVAKKNAL